MLTARMVTHLLNNLADAEEETGHWFPNQNKGQFCAGLRAEVEAGILACTNEEARLELKAAWERYAGFYKG